MIFETNFFWWNSGVWLSQRRFLILDTIGMRCLTDARKITSVYIFQMIKKTKTYSVLYCFSILLVKLYNMQVQSVRYIYLTYELHEQKVIIQKLN